MTPEGRDGASAATAKCRRSLNLSWNKKRQTVFIMADSSISARILHDCGHIFAAINFFVTFLLQSISLMF